MVKVKLKLTQEQSTDIQDYLRNREQAAVPHAADMESVAEDKIPCSDSLNKCDKQVAELDTAKKFEGDDKPEKMDNKSIPKGRSERMPPLAHDVSYCDNLKNCHKLNDVEVAVEKFSEHSERPQQNQSGVPAKCHLQHSSKMISSAVSQLNAAKKFEGDDKPEKMHNKSLLKLKLTQEQSTNIQYYLRNRERAAVSYGIDKDAKKSENGDRPGQNHLLTPAKCQLSSKKISQGSCQTSVSKGMTDVVDGISSDHRKVFIIYDKRMKLHRPYSENDNENAKRIPTILGTLKEKGLLERCGVSSKATPVDENLVSEVHSEMYIQFIKRLPLRGKELEPYYEYLSDKPSEREDFVSSKGTQLAAFLAAGAVIEACCQVATGNYHSAFAIVRPPGHHAKYSQANGFCFLNNIAIGARYLQRVHNAEKILVIDFDVHHGDGTQEIFYEDDTILFCSIHRKSIFPKKSKKKCSYIGEGKGKGFNVNVCLEEELENNDLLAVFDYLFLPIAKEYKPDYVLVSAGFDAAVNDPLGESHVTPDCFGELICKLKTISDGKLVLALEGGYNLDSLAESCAECVKELLDDHNSNAVKCRLEDLHKETLKAINEVKSALVEWWPILADD